jgi:hypothetical protein
VVENKGIKCQILFPNYMYPMKLISCSPSTG